MNHLPSPRPSFLMHKRRIFLFSYKTEERTTDRDSISSRSGSPVCCELAVKGGPCHLVQWVRWAQGPPSCGEMSHPEGGVCGCSTAHSQLLRFCSWSSNIFYSLFGIDSSEEERGGNGNETEAANIFIFSPTTFSFFKKFFPSFPSGVLLWSLSHPPSSPSSLCSPLRTYLFPPGKRLRGKCSIILKSLIFLVKTPSMWVLWKHAASEKRQWQPHSTTEEVSHHKWIPTVSS